MTTVVLTDRNRQMPVDQLLKSAGADQIELRDVNGALVATLVMARDEASYQLAMSLTDDERAQLRAARASPRSEDITTAELLDRLRKLEESGL